MLLDAMKTYIVDKDCTKVTNNVDNTKDESLKRGHGDKRTLLVVNDRVTLGSSYQEIIHGTNRSNLGRATIDSKDE